jgi:hypothetical protein
MSQFQVSGQIMSQFTYIGTEMRKIIMSLSTFYLFAGFVGLFLGVIIMLVNKK